MINHILFPKTLQPDSTELHHIDNKDISIPVKYLIFKQWQGIPIVNTFGNKGLIDFKGIPMFAELAIQHLAVESGWEARWVETYAMKDKIPYYFTMWGDNTLHNQIQEPLQDLVQINLMETVAKSNNNSYTGCWDVLAWYKERTIFIESKRNKKDRFRSNQDCWLCAGLRSGLSADNFLVVKWNFA